jgi:predicted metalloprotease with PDZ domain
LDSRADDKITFSFQAPTSEGLLKGLLRHLGIKNYAFEFADDKIRRVMIIVGSGKEISIPEAPQTEPSAKKEFVSVAEIQSVLDSSQAKSLGLLEGDLIIEYDGVRIRSAQQLVSEVEKKSSQNQIEMIVIREKIPMRLILSGGFVGVKVMTRNIPQEDLNQVFPSE